MGQIKYITGLLMASLFAIAIISFAVNFGIDNESAIQLADDSDFIEINNNIKGNVSSFKDASGESFDALTEATIEPGDETVATGGQFKVTAGSSIGMITNVIKTGYQKIFGSDTGFGIFLTSLTSLMVTVLGFYVWKTWRGNPD